MTPAEELGPSGPQPLHPLLEQVLRRVHAAEQTARGERRRTTFRLMRVLLTAAREVGIPAQALADLLGVTRQSIRHRTTDVEDYLDPQLVYELTELTAEELNALSGGQLTPSQADGATPITYPASSVVRAIINTPTAEDMTTGSLGTKIADFLLARIAEEAAAARQAAAQDPTRTTRGGGAITGAHRLADCEARRRIIELWQRTDDPAAATALYQTLQLLVAAYADHPQFQPEWITTGENAALHS